MFFLKNPLNMFYCIFNSPEKVYCGKRLLEKTETPFPYKRQLSFIIHIAAGQYNL